MIQGNKKMGKNNMATILNGKTGVAIKFVIPLVVTAAMIGASWMDLRGQIAGLRAHLKIATKHISTCKEGMAKNKAIHLALRNEIKEKTKDRWAKSNDLIFMERFCAVNTLKMAPHIRETD